MGSDFDEGRRTDTVSVPSPSVTDVTSLHRKFAPSISLMAHQHPMTSNDIHVAWSNGTPSDPQRFRLRKPVDLFEREGVNVFGGAKAAGGRPFPSTRAILISSVGWPLGALFHWRTAWAATMCAVR